MEERKKKRRSRLKRGFALFSLLGVIAFSLFNWWQPWEMDWIPRPKPKVNPRVDPDSSTLFESGTKIAIVTAHPDDAEFYLAGLLSKLGEAGAEMTLIVATDGDKGYYPFEDHEKNSRIRRKEQDTAAKAWGAKEVLYLKFPDGRLTVTDELVQSIRNELLDLKPDYVFGFDPDFWPRLSHADHRRTGEATAAAIKGVESIKWLMLFQTDSPNFLFDVTSIWERKRELLLVHASQFSKADNGVNAMTNRAKTYGKLLGAEYAEGVRAVKMR